MNAPIEWLLAGEPWVAYRTRVDLLGQSADDPLVLADREAMLENQRVRGLIADLSGWPGKVIASHKSAGQSYHKLTFAADLGLKADDPGMGGIIASIQAHQSPEGLFQLPMNIPTHFGGSGQDEWSWVLCDAPLTLYGLVKLGLASDPGVIQAVEYLAALARDNGWPCAGSKELGRFRGPGRKEDPCPYANLAMLKLLAAQDEWCDSPVCRAGAETLLTLWSESQTLHPYMFYMGTDFRKIKVPFIWYDLLHVLEVLTQFAWLKQDPRLLDMLAVLQRKMDAQGRFTLESVWTAWKDWEFGQKKEPSRWLTLSAWRVMHRIEN